MPPLRTLLPTALYYIQRRELLQLYTGTTLFTKKTCWFLPVHTVAARVQEMMITIWSCESAFHPSQIPVKLQTKTQLTRLKFSVSTVFTKNTRQHLYGMAPILPLNMEVLALADAVFAQRCNGQMCSRHLMVCTFIPIKQPKSSRNKKNSTY